MPRLAFITLLILMAVSAGAGCARADVIAVTIGPAGAQRPDLTGLGGSADQFGVEAFDDRTSAGFTTDFGTSGVIVGRYIGDFQIVDPNQYGGAGGRGRFIQTFSTSGYDVLLTHAAAIPGVNYFGFWLSALDSGNQLSFWRAGSQIGTYTPGQLRAVVGGHATYFGNPAPDFRGQDAGEPFAFVNFFDTNGFFDEIRFSETPAIGGYESDNHTVGYRVESSTAGTPIPEPAALGLLGVAALLGRGIWRRVSGRHARPNVVWRERG